MNKRSVYTKAEIRATADGKKLTLRGYPILFNVETEVYDFWYGKILETILPTALDNTNLSGVYLLGGHKPDNLLGREGVNMRLEIDETGLFFECDLPNTQYARDEYNLVEAGILDGMSFGFRSNDEVNSSTMKRTITQIDELYEITITPFPAYKEASVVAKRDSEEEEKRKRVLEEKNRELRNQKIKELEDL